MAYENLEVAKWPDPECLIMIGPCRGIGKLARDISGIVCLLFVSSSFLFPLDLRDPALNNTYRLC